MLDGWIADVGEITRQSLILGDRRVTKGIFSTAFFVLIIYRTVKLLGSEVVPIAADQIIEVPITVDIGFYNVAAKTILSYKSGDTALAPRRIMFSVFSGSPRRPTARYFF